MYGTTPPLHLSFKAGICRETVGGWLWYCDEHDTHGNADSEDEAEHMASAHAEFVSADEGPCEVVAWPEGERTPVAAPAQRPVDDNHALRIGWVAGALMRSVEIEPLTGVKTRGVEILDDDDDGNHLDTIRLYAPSGTFLVTVTRETSA